MILRLCLLFLLVAGHAAAGVSLTKLAAHPRLFADAARFEELKKAVTEEGGARDFHQVLRKRADVLLKQKPAERILTGKRLLGVSRQSLECITVSAMVGKLDGKAEYKERAIAEMRALAGFSDWNPSHFLDVAEATFAMGIGYDWLYEDLSAADRDLISTAIIEKGLKPSMPAEGKKEPSWVRGTNNWNQVCHGGMTIGALAVADRDPELAGKIIDRAIANLNRSAAAYAPDGVYPEGPGYWGYGTSYHVSLVEALRTSLGDSYGLEKFPGFLKTADFIVQMESPAGNFYNYSDNGQSRGFQTPLFWFARELKRPDLLSSDLVLLEKLGKKSGTLDRMMPLALIWWDGKKPVAQASPPTSWIAGGKVPLAVFRQKWGDPSAAFLALKGGKPDISHGHMDVGSFIFEKDGVRWADDLGVQSYNTLESRGVDLWNFRQDSQRWQVFRLGPDSHNIPRFNDGQQNVMGQATVTKSDATKRFTVLDLTALYAPVMTSVTRGVRMMPDGSVVIRDEWQAGEKPASMTFQWLTKAAVTPEKTGATLSSAGKTLHLQVASGTSFSVEVDDLAAPVHDYDLANPGLKRIRFVLETKPGEKGSISVAASPTGGGAGPTTSLETW